jgi:methylenetetrahydrofolate reductase (NADPH)
VVADLCEQLLNGGAPSLHFYTMNQSQAVKQLVERISAHQS